MDPKPHILIVDDDPSIRDSLSSFLGRAGFMITTAQNGEAALKELDKARPDLLILDVLMPRLDGRETLRRMRGSGNWMPVILLTEVGDATERAMALEDGADDYINKPFEARNWSPASGLFYAGRNPASLPSACPGFWSCSNTW